MSENKFQRYKLDFSKEGIKKSKTFRISTGFKNLDKLIGDGLGAELIVLGAISSLGKSTFALQMAQQISAQKINDCHIPVIYFSLEMSKKNISLKLSSKTAFEMVKNGADYAEAKKKALSASEISGKYIVEGEKELLRDAALEKCSEDTQSLYIIERDKDNLSFSADSIAETVNEFIELNGGLRPVVFVDYLQILSSSNNSYGTKNERQIVDENITRLWLLAKEKNIPVFVISSVNRESYNKPISFAAFKESGAIEFTADVVLGMQFSAVREMDKASLRSFSADAEKQNDPRRLEIVVLKQRYGMCGSDVFCRFNYYPAYSYFEEVNKFPARRASGGAEYPSGGKSKADEGAIYL